MSCCLDCFFIRISAYTALVFYISIFGACSIFLINFFVIMVCKVCFFRVCVSTYRTCVCNTTFFSTCGIYTICYLIIMLSCRRNSFFFSLIGKRVFILFITIRCTCSIYCGCNFPSFCNFFIRILFSFLLWCSFCFLFSRS